MGWYFTDAPGENAWTNDLNTGAWTNYGAASAAGVVAGVYDVTLELTVVSAGSVDSRVGLSTQTTNTSFTVVDSNNDGTPESIQFPGGSSIPYYNDGGSAWLFQLELGSVAHVVTVTAYKHIEGHVDLLSVSYNNVVYASTPQITSITWTSGNTVSKR